MSNAHSSITEPRIYVDIDETLLTSDRVSRHPEWVEVAGSHVFDSQGEEWVTICRPYAHELVEACRALADTNYLTAGGSKFQTQVMKLHGFPPIPLISWEFHDTILPSGRALLIDDVDMLGTGVQHKLRKILVDVALPRSRNITEAEVAERFKLITVPSWAEPDMQDTALLAVIDEVRRWSSQAHMPAAKELTPA